MNLGVFLAIGESLEDFESKGQLKRLVDYNIKKYCQNFDTVFIFSYGVKKYKVPKNCIIVTNETKLHRYLYAFLLPVIHLRYVRQCDVFRGLQLTGGIPASVSKVIFHKRFVLNFGYEYSHVAKIEKKYLQAFLFKILETPLLSLSDIIISPTKAIYKILRKKYGEKVVYLTNGVDINLFHPVTKTKQKKLSIVSFGRLESQKNFSSLIRAMPEVRYKYTLTIYGEGSQRKNLVSLAKKNKVNLRLAKPVNYQEVARILRISDIFVLPSLKEGSPKILLEAMASGCAIIASNISEVTELLEENESALITQASPEKIADAINSLANIDKRRRLGHAARIYATKKYDINPLLAREIKILKSLYEK